MINLIQKNVTLCDKNWFKTGGPARFYAEPTNLEEFKQALAFAKNQKLEVFILGAGANVIISDQGFDGLVICPKLNEVTFDKLTKQTIESQELSLQECLVTAGAGTHFSDLINICFKNNVLGLEEFSGIPGTIGGAVFINLHFFKFLLSQFLVSATIISAENQESFAVGQNWFNFGYNQSALQERKFYLVDATFKLKTASDLEIAYAQGRNHEMIRYRTWRYPSQNTCGSFFRNFYESEVNLEINGKKMIFVAYYLDKLGFKGTLQSGQAIVSHQHANMLVTQPGATSTDLISLARTMQTQVLQEFGVLPQPECLLVGFKEYPLLTHSSPYTTTQKSQSVNKDKQPL